MHQRIQQVGQFVQDTVQKAARQRLTDHGDDEHMRGFTKAASISLGLVQNEIDALKEQMKSPGLSKAEQAHCAHLEELKSQIEAEFDRYWQGSGFDWHPPKPLIVKGVIRHNRESSQP